ncbi:unnamed protein product [Sympodiomycopsis kandeliae]
MANLLSGVSIDDTSLLLLVLIIAVLIFSAIAARWYQPTIHPLILSRQSDVSQVHNSNESPVYRNINAPHKFDLASKPSKEVTDIQSLLLRSEKKDVKRNIYDVQKSNQNLLDEAKQFAKGLIVLTGSGPNTHDAALAVSVEADSWYSLVAIVAGSLESTLQSLVIPPLQLPEGQPSQFPADAKRLSAVFTTANAIHKAASMGIATADTLFIVESQEQASLAQRNLSRNDVKIITFREVLEKGREQSQSADSSSTPQSIATSYWLGSSWSQVSHRAIVAGITAYLAFYPAHEVPNEKDTIYIEQSPFLTSPSLHLGAAATPSGLTLVLATCFTGSNFQRGPITSSLQDPNPVTHPNLSRYNPTIIYASASGTSSLALALTSLSKKSPFGPLMVANKLRTLRSGTLNQKTIYDYIFFNSIRKQSHTTSLRAVTILNDSSSWKVSQRLLDILRTHLGIPVMNAEVPLYFANHPEISITAPVSSSHFYDVQSFKANNNISEIPAHVGPPSVTLEMKLVKSSDISGSVPHGWQRFSNQDDFIGQIQIRGNTITGASEIDTNQWYTVNTREDDDSDQTSTAPAHALFRSNGTLLILPPSIHAEKRGMVPIPTMSTKYPIKGRNKIGSGDDHEVHDKEKAQTKKTL